MLQQQVTAFPRPDFDESRGLELADHLGPSHRTIVNLPLGYVKKRRPDFQIDVRLRLTKVTLYATLSCKRCLTGVCRQL